VTSFDGGATSQRRSLRSLVASRLSLVSLRPRPTRNDVVAGITNGIVSIPDGMTSGVIAGINPVYGLYALMVNTPVAALTVSTQLMVVNTTSAMILVASDGLGTLEGDERLSAMVGISLVAGIFQLMLGILGLGTLTRFVSNAVMTGLLTGVAVLIILGQLWDFFGYSGSGETKLQKTADLIVHPGDIDPWTTAIGVSAVALMVLLARTKFARVNLLVGLAVATIAAAILNRDSVALVSSLGEIPRGLPSFHVPPLLDALKMITAGIAVGVVGLLQAAGVAQRYSNPDGQPTDDSRDFMAQGIANIAGSFFRGMPSGGSLSSTALGVSAGAQTRWASFFMAIVVMIAVLVFADVLSLIPIAALAALLIYSAALSIKFRLVQDVLRTNWHSWSAMVLTFLATLFVPLQQAIMLGVVMAAVLFVYRSSVDVRVVRLVRSDGLFIEQPVPARLESNQTVLLDIHGSLFYAGARTLSELLPTVDDARDAVVILRLRGIGEFGSTLMGVLNAYATSLQKGGGALFLAGVSPETREHMIRSGQAPTIGENHIFAGSEVRHGSMSEALAAAEGQHRLPPIDAKPGSAADQSVVAPVAPEVDRE